MVLFRGLISSQSLTVMVIAQQSIVKAFATLDGVGYGRSSNKKAVIFHA